MTSQSKGRKFTSNSENPSCIYLSILTLIRMERVSPYVFIASMTTEETHEIELYLKKQELTLKDLELQMQHQQSITRWNSNVFQYTHKHTEISNLKDEMAFVSSEIQWVKSVLKKKGTYESMTPGL